MRPGNQTQPTMTEEALSHPIRVRILGWLRHQEAKTQSETGKALALSNAAVRYHMNVLEGADLVTFQGTRPGPNGITEKLYAYNPEVWKQAGGQAGNAGDFDFMLDYTFASIHEIHRKAIEMIKGDWKPAFLAGSVGAFATPEDTHQLRKELNRLLEDFHAAHGNPESPGAFPMAITFAVLPSRPEDAGLWAGERVFEWDGQ